MVRDHINLFKQLKTCYSLIILLFLGTNLKGIDDIQLSSIKDCVESLERKNSEYYKYINEGIALSLEKGDSSYLLYFYGTKGDLLRHKNPDLALEYYFKALKIAEKIGCEQNMAASYLSIATNANLREEEKITYFKKAISIFQQKNDTIRLIMTYNNIADLYRNSCIDSTLSYLNKIRTLSKEIHYNVGLAMYNINIAIICVFTTKDYETALENLYQAKTLIPSESEYVIEIDRLLMKVYSKTDHIDSALYYFDRIRKTFTLRPDIAADTYEFLSKHYLDSKDLTKALLFDEKADSINGYIQTRNKENQLKFLEMEYNSKLHEQKLLKLNAEMQRSNTIRIAVSLVLFITIAFFLMLFRWQHQNAKKKQYIIEQNRQRLEERRKHLEEKKKHLEMEQKLLSSELENSELKRKYLYDELKYTNKELSSFATSIVQSHTLWDDVRTRIKEISQEKNQDNIKSLLKELDTMLLQVFERNEQRYEFIQRSRQLNHSIVFYLKTYYKSLTEKDINLLILILLKFAPKEIAVLCNIEPVSVKKSRQRIRKKMGLDSEETLEMFFERIMTEIKMRETG